MSVGDLKRGSNAARTFKEGKTYPLLVHYMHNVAALLVLPAFSGAFNRISVFISKDKVCSYVIC